MRSQHQLFKGARRVLHKKAPGKRSVSEKDFDWVKEIFVISLNKSMVSY